MSEKKELTVYYNPFCSTCKEVMGVLEGSSCEINAIEYLKDFPTKEELKELLVKLGLKPHDIIRTKEPIYQKKYEGKNLTDDAWLDAIMENHILLQRPIIIDGNKAIIGRPIEKVIDLVRST